MCPVVQAQNYPADLVRLAEALPPSAWLYTGAMENHPALVARLAASRELLGNSAETVRLVRDPFRVYDALRAANLLACPVAATPEDLPRDGSWLRKPLRSASGASIARWQGEDVTKDLSNVFYYQQFVEGESRAGIFVASDQGAQLLGVTEQGTGWDWLAAQPFHYCGSIGPCALTAAEQDAWQRIGETLAKSFPLRGLFGIDAIVNANGIWPVEVNPRYTASVELLERANAFSALALHVRACRGASRMEGLDLRTTFSGKQFAKGILFAERDILVPDAILNRAQADNARVAAELHWPEAPGWNWPAAADLPRPGSLIRAGWPILTLFAEGDSRAAALAGLQGQAFDYRKLLDEIA